MIKGIFFDANGVLYDRQQSTTSFARQLLAERGYADILPQPEEARRKLLHTQATDGRISADTYWHEYLRMSGVGDETERAALVARIMAHTHNVHPLPGARATVQELKRRGFLLGVITDTMFPLEWKMRWLARAGVAEFMDVIASSTVVAAHKPDPPIYLEALRQAALTPAEAAFVGHSAHELDGARRVGMTTVAVNVEPGARADYYIATLPDLLALSIFRR